MHLTQFTAQYSGTNPLKLISMPYIQIYKEYPSICQYKHIATVVGFILAYGLWKDIPCKSKYIWNINSSLNPCWLALWAVHKWRHPKIGNFYPPPSSRLRPPPPLNKNDVILTWPPNLFKFLIIFRWFCFSKGVPFPFYDAKST